ncbi:hypothetical protein [Dysgonomonas termitidis]|uniref:Mobilization protein n=1 Tax=Dysgonomonas termitidis TaxID=1516126 RepID=A0ABV9KT48_9BACT
MTKLYSLFGGTTTDTNIKAVEVNQVVQMQGYSYDRYVIHKIIHNDYGYQYHLINLRTLDMQQSRIIKPLSQKFGIGMYYDENNIEFMPEAEVAELYAKADAKREAKRDAQKKEEERREAVRVIGRKWLQENLPDDAQALIVARLKQDESDSQSDYYASSTQCTVILGFSKHKRDSNKVGKPLKSSVFGKTVGFDGLEKRMTESSLKIKEGKVRDQTRKIVSGALTTSQDEWEFRRKLQSSNIDLVLRRNDEGRIYGATFINHNNRCVLNGSRLGKEFSANVLNEKFSSNEYIDNTQPQTIQPADVSTINSPVNLESIGSLVDSVLDIPVFDNSANPDANNRQLKKRKKKRRYGRQM